MTDIMEVSKAGDSFFSQMGGDHKMAVTAFKVSLECEGELLLGPLAPNPQA